jgi:hypothetical protein
VSGSKKARVESMSALTTPARQEDVAVLDDDGLEDDTEATDDNDDTTNSVALHSDASPEETPSADEEREFRKFFPEPVEPETAAVDREAKRICLGALTFTARKLADMANSAKKELSEKQVKYITENWASPPNRWYNALRPDVVRLFGKKEWSLEDLEHQTPAAQSCV